MKKLNVMLVGVGYWGKNYARVLKELNDYFDNIYIIDTSIDLLNKIKNSYKNINISTNISEYIDNVDCVIITTPANTHYKIAKYCIKNKKHVLIEKPMTLNCEDSKKLSNLANDNNIILMVGYTILFTEGFKYMRNYIKNNDTNIYYIDCQRTNLGIIRSDCNVVFDLTSHDIAVILFLLDKLPISISANDGKYMNNNYSDIVNISMYFDNNIMVNLHTSWLDCDKKRLFKIISEDYTMTLDDMNLNNPIIIYDKKIKKLNFNNDNSHLNINKIVPFINWKEPLKNECIHFYNCIINNQQPISNSNLGYNVNYVIDKINESITKSKKIYLGRDTYLP